MILNDPLSSIKIEEMNIDSSKKLKLKLIENGGFCTIILRTHLDKENETPKNIR